jgi:hypothetical protein
VSASRAEQGPHDRGGMLDEARLDRSEHEPHDWELLVEGLSAVLSSAGIRSAHESRRAQESLTSEHYESLLYYERWAVAAEMILIEKGLLTEREIDTRAAQIRAHWTAT